MDKKTTETMFSSITYEYSTPDELFNTLDDEFHFTLDPCSTHENAKCVNHFTIAEDGLSRKWEGIVFMNPPYGREINKWIKKAYESSLEGCTVVCLLPSRTDTRWFHEYVMKSQEIRYIKGRLKFGNSKNSAPFPSIIVIFRPYCKTWARY